MKLLAGLTLSGMLLLGQSDRSAPHAITAVRHWSLKDVTRVAVEVSGPFEFRTERLHNPERVYYDIPRTTLHIENRRYYAETIGDTLLQKIRVAETNPGTMRVVLDLVGDAEASSSTLTNPYRLIIELRASKGGTSKTSIPTSEPVLPLPRVNLPAPVLSAPVAAPLKPLPEPPKVSARIESLSPPVLPALAEAPPKLEEAAPAGGLPATPPAAAPLTPAVPSGPEEIGTAARHTSAGTTSLVRALGLKINRVVIDPGHGGHDQGTEGAKGLIEKELVLDVALRVGKLVQDRMGAEVIYTRSDDTFVSLEGRTALANEKKADLFLSIHANSSPYKQISGVETYYLNINGTKDAMDVAARENGQAQSSIFDLQDIVKKIARHDKSEESHEFAKRLEASLFTFTLKDFPANKDRGVKTAPFVVLIGANMPSVLAEIGFVTNLREEALLKRPDYRQRLAEALYKGIEKYSDSLSHFQTAERP